MFEISGVHRVLPGGCAKLLWFFHNPLNLWMYDFFTLTPSWLLYQRLYYRGVYTPSLNFSRGFIHPFFPCLWVKYFLVKKFSYWIDRHTSWSFNNKINTFFQVYRKFTGRDRDSSGPGWWRLEYSQHWKTFHTSFIHARSLQIILYQTGMAIYRIIL